MKYQHKFSEDLEKILKKACKNPKLLHEFLFDILSPAEYKELAVRWQIMKMLWEKVPQREIAKTLGVSVATVTRGSRELANKKGGFRMMLENK
jgi:TrpR family trp operon transcriptional repressor